MTIQIPGIDTEKAIKFYGNDIELYKTVLSTWTKSMPDFLNEIKELIEGLKTLENDNVLADYAVIMHGIKGTCATIGTEDLKEEALALETLAKAGDKESVLARNDAFIRKVYDLIDKINKWLEQQ